MTPAGPVKQSLLPGNNLGIATRGLSRADAVVADGIKKVWRSLPCAPGYCGITWRLSHGWTDEMESAAAAESNGYYASHGFTLIGLAGKGTGDKWVGTPGVGDAIVMPNWAGGNGHVGTSLGDGTYISNLNGKLTIAPIPKGAHVWRKVR